jgi:hypothetical protein
LQPPLMSNVRRHQGRCHDARLPTVADSGLRQSDELSELEGIDGFSGSGGSLFCIAGVCTRVPKSHSPAHGHESQRCCFQSMGRLVQGCIGGRMVGGIAMRSGQVRKQGNRLSLADLLIQKRVGRCARPLQRACPSSSWNRSRTSWFFPLAMAPNPSIEGTCNIRLRRLSPAPHVKR